MAVSGIDVSYGGRIRKLPLADWPQAADTGEEKYARTPGRCAFDGHGESPLLMEYPFSHGAVSPPRAASPTDAHISPHLGIPVMKSQSSTSRRIGYAPQGRLVFGRSNRNARDRCPRGCRVGRCDRDIAHIATDAPAPSPGYPTLNPPCDAAESDPILPASARASTHTRGLF